MKKVQNKRIPLVDLRMRLNSLDEERDAILKLIASYEQSDKIELPPSFTMRGQVVNAVIELIQKKKGYVTTREIFPYVEKKNILKGVEDKKALLAIILYQEVNKKGSSRLKKVARGIYDIK
ncbi:MAG: hypothetical protein HY033_13460 [Ignavibacteriae bacterium]|nr:hypothetical protein [Ignavibacteriota bacterium]